MLALRTVTYCTENEETPTCTAVANVGFAFTGFTGDCTGNTCLLSNVVSETAVTANFVGTYTIGGTVSGLTGTGLVLQLNLDPATNLTINANGSFTFPTLLNDGSKFKVALITQPPGQVCSIFAAKGTLYGANNTGVTVTCATSAVTSVTGTVPDAKGVATSSITGGGASCGFLHASFVTATSVAPTPANVAKRAQALEKDN